MHKIRKFCTKFDYLILRIIIKFVATRYQISKLKCTNFNFGWDSALDPTGGVYSVPQTPYLDLRGLLLREGREIGGEWERERELRGEGENEREGIRRGGEKRVGREGTLQGLVDTPMF